MISSLRIARIGMVAALFTSTTVGPMEARPNGDDEPLVRIVGVRVLVDDMNEAVRFYSGTLGFNVVSTAGYPNLVELKSAQGFRFLLSQTKHPARYEYSGAVRATFGFQVNDMAVARDRLTDEGISFIEPEPEKVGIGLATTFKDPSGNILYLLEQQVGDQVAFEEPRIYNVGFHVPDESVARTLYCDVLGFVVRTERYFPAIPLGHSDGTFAFMLHEKPDLSPRTSKYPDEAQIVPLFETADLSAVVAKLDEAGVKHELVESNGGGIAFAIVYDIFGNVSEIRGPETHSTN